MPSLWGIRRATANPPVAETAGSASVTRCSAPRRAASTRSGRSRATPARGQGGGDAGQPVRPVRHLHDVPGDEPPGLEEPVQPGRGLLRLGQQYVGRPLRQLAPTRRAVRRRLEAGHHQRAPPERDVVAVRPAPPRDSSSRSTTRSTPGESSGDQDRDVAGEAVEPGDVGRLLDGRPQPGRRRRPRGRSRRRSTAASGGPRRARRPARRCRCASRPGPTPARSPAARSRPGAATARGRRTGPGRAPTATRPPRGRGSLRRVTPGILPCSRPAPSRAAPACGGPRSGSGRRRAGRPTRFLAMNSTNGFISSVYGRCSARRC